jgi:hypothetical protein
MKTTRSLLNAAARLIPLALALAVAAPRLRF